MKKIILTLGLVLLSSTASAAEYSVSPVLIENKIAPRDSFEEMVKITNTSDRKLRIFPTVNEVTVGEEGELKTFVPASMSDNSDSVTSWISVTRGRVEINPGETIKIPISFAISPKAIAGDYHAFIGFGEGSKRDEVEQLVMSGRAPGVVVRLSMEDKKNEYLRLNRYHINRFIISDKNRVAEYELENIGATAITPVGEIIFYSSRGVELATAPVNPEQVSIQPNGRHTFTVTLPDLGIIGNFKALLNVEYGTKVRANLYDTAFFNIVPITYLAIFFSVLLIVSLLLVLYYHRRNRFETNAEEDVAVYVRSGKTGEEKDHDINLKK